MRKSCAVPQCDNTSKLTPSKLFIHVPLKKTMRYKWLNLAGRDPTAIGLNSNIYFCEDHFDLPNDMENYMKYHIMGYIRQIRLKPDCIPTKFPCNPDKRSKNKRRCGLKPPNIKFKPNKQRNQIVKECLNVGSSGYSQLHYTLTGKPADPTHPKKYDERVDIKCDKNYEFSYDVVKQEIFSDSDSYDKSFDKQNDKSMNKEVVKYTDQNKKGLGYISKVETIENVNQNYTLNSQELNFCSEDRMEINTDIKKEFEYEPEENQEVIDYISTIDIHEHKVMLNSDYNPESDTKPSLNYINDTVTVSAVNDGSINLNNDCDIDIKPDINNLSLELDELTNFDCGESEEGHIKTIDDKLAMDTKPLIIQCVYETGECNALKNSEDVTNSIIEKREFMDRNATESVVSKCNVSLKTYTNKETYNNHNMKHKELNCTHTEINYYNWKSHNCDMYHQYNDYQTEELHSNNQTKATGTENTKNLNETTSSQLDTIQAKVRITDKSAIEHIVEVKRYGKRDSNSGKRKRKISYDTDDSFNRIKGKDDINKCAKKKQSKAKRPNFKKPIRVLKINGGNPKIETVSDDKETVFNTENLKFGLSKINQNHAIDLHKLEGHTNFVSKSNKYGDNYLEYKYSCIICNFRTNIKKWMESHEILHLDKDTEDILVCDHCDYITKVKFRLINHMKAHMNEVRYQCKICPYKCKYSYNLISHMTTHIEKPLSCSICDYKCAHKRLLNNHLKTHTDKKSFECDHCEYRSTLKQYLVRHIRTHTGEKPYSCKLCEAKFAWSGDLAKHSRIHSNEKPHSCNICAYKTVDKQTLTKHMRIHSSEKPFKCKYCPYSSAMRSNLRTHLRIHSDERPYSCELCNYTAKHYGALASHTRIHTKEKPYKCHLCDYRATQKTHLDRHIMRHTGEKPFACNICSYKCSRKGSLVYHMKTHTSNRPHSCELCDYKCSRKSLLAIHTRTHTGEKPFSCDQCDFKCARGSSLHSHKLSHTGLKPYTCDVCNRKLSSKSGLNKHKVCHTSEKPYACELCDYEVTKKYLLTLHMAKTHI